MTLCVLLPFFGVAQGDNPNAPQIKIIGGDQTINCTSQPVEIGIEVKHWQEGFTYQWSHGPADSILQVKPQQTRVYEVNIQHEALGYNVTRSIEVKVFNAPVVVQNEQIIVDKQTCPGTDIQLGIDPIGGHAPFTFAWSSGQIVASPIVNPTEETAYTVVVTDICGTQDQAVVTVSFENHDPLIAPQTKEIPFLCDGEDIDLVAPAQATQGGVGYGYTYTFSTWSEHDQALPAKAIDGATYTYLVSDACGIQEASSRLVLVAEEMEVPTAEDVIVCKGAEAQITRSTDPFYFWDGQTMHTDFADLFERDTEVNLIYIDECGITHAAVRNVVIDKVETDFDMQVNHFDRIVQLYAPLSADGQEITWYLNAEKVSVEPDPIIALLEADENEIILEVENENGCIERTGRTVILQDGVELPSAFSPNGDGLNDKFSVRFEDELVKFNINIFDRWGQLIYESNDQYFEWDGMMGGKASPLTSYAYILRAETVEGRQIEKRGTVSTLIFD